MLVQTELSKVTKQWADIEKTWNKREADMAEVKETATQYHNTHDPLLAKLTNLEQRLAEQPPVGTEKLFTNAKLIPRIFWFCCKS